MLDVAWLAREHETIRGALDADVKHGHILNRAKVLVPAKSFRLVSDALHNLEHEAHPPPHAHSQMVADDGDDFVERVEMSSGRMRRFHAVSNIEEGDRI